MIKNPQKKQQNNYEKCICEVSSRIRQVIVYIKQNWIQQNNNGYSKYHQNSRKAKSLGIITLGRKTKQNEYYRTPLLTHKSYDSYNYDYQHEKLRIVEQFLLQVSTNLKQICQNLEKIHSKISEYQYLQNKLKSNQKIDKEFRQRKSSNLDSQNLISFEGIFRFILEFFFCQTFNQLINKHPKRIAIFLLSIDTKLSILPDLIESAYTFKGDITTSEINMPKYSHIWKKIKIVQMDSAKNKIQNQISLLKRMMKITTSAVVTENYVVNFQLVRKMIFGLSFPYFFLADEQSELRCYQIWRNPKIQSLNQVWNLPQKGAISECKKLIFPSIKTCFFIYVPAINQHILQFNKNMKIKQNINSYPDIFNFPLNPQQSVRVLVLYSGRFRYQDSFKQFQPFTLFPCWNIPQQIDLQTIMIHLHGGGFVALSSQTSQSYTRKWANQLKIPIFSIDYRKPPQFRFPTALQDCATVYKFIVQNIYKYFNVRPKNIILTGDSAGGNLAVSLYALLLQQNYPILPSKMFLAYPAVDLRRRYSPSRLNSFDDPILLPPLLFLCLNQYLGGNSLLEHDPLASPILLTQYFIRTGKHPTKQTFQQYRKWPKRWPKTTIMVGKKDPLYDDSLRLMERLIDGGADAKLIIYNQLSHAFLSLDNIISACSQVLNDSIIQLKQLLKTLM